MNEERKKKHEKVVLFPGLVDKLVLKGMEALKQKMYLEALDHFEQTLQIEPDHPQARFGVALSLIEQGKLNEAKDVTEQMLKEDIGNYYDILQVHISLLVQLGHYEEVVTMLEGIMVEDKLPVHLAESFYHLLHFSRQMVEGTRVEIDDSDILSEEWTEMLYNGSEEKQRLAIQMLGKMPGKVFLEAVQRFLIDEQYDPVLKSMILQLLKEKNIETKLEVHKFGKKIDVTISLLEDVFHEKFGKNTIEIIEKKLENENPSLMEMVTPVWWHFLFALYPITPEPFQPSLWAAAIHRIGYEMLGIEYDTVRLAEDYNVDVEEMIAASNQLVEVEQGTYKGSGRNY